MALLKARSTTKECKQDKRVLKSKGAKTSGAKITIVVISDIYDEFYTNNQIIFA